jgi:proline dehydrogenase
MGVGSKALVELVSRMPETVIWRFARRYIAGLDIQDALNVREELYGLGMLNTMDILGEDVMDTNQIDETFSLYHSLVEKMYASKIPGNISVKLTQLGLKADPDNLESRVRTLAELAGTHNILVRIDMEDATTTSFTLKLYDALRQDLPRIGTVVQAYMKRSKTDVLKLTEKENTNIRICKGIYKESPDIALQKRGEIRDNFMNLLRILLDRNAYPAIATHDPVLVKQSLEEIKRRGLTPDKYEFQMLHGVGFNMRKMLLDGNHPLRIYIPFGSAWRAYSLRRFRENPKLAFYVLKNLISSG